MGMLRRCIHSQRKLQFSNEGISKGIGGDFWWNIVSLIHVCDLVCDFSPLTLAILLMLMVTLTHNCQSLSADKDIMFGLFLIDFFSCFLLCFY